MDDTIAAAMEQLIQTFFGLASDPHNPDAITTANDALHNLDRLLTEQPREPGSAAA